MNTRTLSILIGTLCVGAAAGIALFSQGVQATELPPGSFDFGSFDFGAEGSNEAGNGNDRDSDFQDVQAANGTFVPSKRGGGFRPAKAEREQEDTSGWTAGVVRGDIQLAVSVLDKLGSIRVCVEEMRNAFSGSKYEPAKRLFAEVERGLGTPTFEVRDVPFSKYPYRVTVLASGLNGSKRTVSVTKAEPVHDVLLAITPGAPFTILLRDQDQQAHRDIDLVMRPVGHPLGRPTLAGKSDNYGSVIFDSVLAGNYEVVATINAQAFGDPKQVTVQPGARNYGPKIQAQGHTMTIPRGMQLDVRVHDRFGYPLDDCTVTASRTDQHRPRDLEGVTRGGQLRFEHLQPGTWQLTVQRDKFQRIDQQLHVRADQGSLTREIRLVRARSLTR